MAGGGLRWVRNLFRRRRSLADVFGEAAVRGGVLFLTGYGFAIREHDTVFLAWVIPFGMTAYACAAIMVLVAVAAGPEDAVQSRRVLVAALILAAGAAPGLITFILFWPSLSTWPAIAFVLPALMILGGVAIYFALRLCPPRSTSDASPGA